MINRLIAKAHLFMLDQKGVTAIEYGLIAALIAVVAIGTISSIGNGLVTKFGAVSAAL